jgi:hypothetical protein
MIPRRILVIQTLLEAALPVYGYFYWNWDTSFVLLWFLLDWLVSYVITWLKTKKRYKYSRQVMEKKLATQRLLLGFLSILVVVFLGWFTLPNLTENFHWLERIWAFLSYADMGIPQGAILLPLLALNGYMLYSKQFVQLKMHERIGMSNITAHLRFEALLVVPIAAIAFTISFWVPYSPEFLLFGSTAGITLVRLLKRT